MTNIEKHSIVCASSGYEVDDHFANVGKMIGLTKGAERKVADNHFAEVSIPCSGYR